MKTYKSETREKVYAAVPLGPREWRGMKVMPSGTIYYTLRTYTTAAAAAAAVNERGKRKRK